jgi:hypothetical protein
MRRLVMLAQRVLNIEAKNIICAPKDKEYLISLPGFWHANVRPSINWIRCCPNRHTHTSVVHYRVKMPRGAAKAFTLHTLSSQHRIQIFDGSSIIHHAAQLRVQKIKNKGTRQADYGQYLVSYVIFIFRITAACRGPFNTKLPITACQYYATKSGYTISHIFCAYEYCWLYRVYIRVFTLE